MNLYFKKRKRFLRKALTGLILFLIGSAIFIGLTSLLRDVPRDSWATHPAFMLFIMTLLFIFIYKPLDKAIVHLFRTVLFKKKSYGQLTLMNLAEELTLILDLKEMGNLVVNTFGEILHLKSVILMTAHHDDESLTALSGFGWEIKDLKKIKLDGKNALLEVIKRSGHHVLVRGQVTQGLAWQEAAKVAQGFEALRASWVIPIWVQGKLLGLLGFASERPDKTFDETDFQFFREFSRQLASPLRNALVVEQLKLENSDLRDAQSKMVQQTKLKAIEQLAAGLAHEIHNPLTIISGKSQVLLLQKDRSNLDPKTEDVLKTIVKQTKRAADITRKLLMFSQGSGGKKESVQLEQVLEDTLALVSYQTELERIKIVRIIQNSIPRIRANVGELREVFLNLILNAVESVGQDGKIEIEISNNTADQLIEVTISDTGKGIPEENIEKLFNPFFTTRTDGTGLGLFTSKQIIHRLGGAIRAESKPGVGSLFMIELPYAILDSNYHSESEQDNSKKNPEHVEEKV